QSWQTLSDLKTRYESEDLIYGNQAYSIKALQDDYLKNTMTLQQQLNDEKDAKERQKLKKRLNSEIKDYRKKLLRLHNYPLVTDLIGIGGDMPKNFDKDMARFNKNITRSIYEMSFLGIIPVRSGRHTSSSYGLWGYIGTYQAIGSPAIAEPRKLNWVKTEISEADVIRSTFPAFGWQESLPFLRHMTYGNLLRTLSLPAIHITQPIAAASRRYGLIADGMPGQLEPQFPSKPHPWKAMGELGGAIAHFVPSPVSIYTYSRLWMNPAREGAFSKRFRKLNDVKYAMYKAASVSGVKNYALEGQTDRQSYKVGPYSRMMGSVDKIYSSSLAGSYPPVYYTDPYGRSLTFPWIAENINRVTPGTMSERSEKSIMSDIFRREKPAIEQMYERKSFLKQYGWKKEVWGLAPAHLPYGMITGAFREAKYRMQRNKYKDIIKMRTCPKCGQKYFGSNHVCRGAGPIGGGPQRHVLGHPI
ncbi:MAG: hypothetical protein ABIG39_01265, partial [Candidatus Micrarchaeota archaeon]